MKKLSLLLLVSILITGAVASSVSAQEKQEFSDPDWGNSQRSDERKAYWDMMEHRGATDSDLTEARAKAYREFTAMPRPKGFMTQAVSSWEQVGGSQGGYVSGRPTSIAFDKQHPQTCFLGTSGGGVWKSTNLGSNWVFVSGSFASYAMGGLAVDYTDGNIVYAGTGDLYDRSGDGLYKSFDGGLNWTLIASATKVGSQINQVVLDPVTPTTVYITTSGDLKKSTDAGLTWKRILNVGGTAHLVIDPNDASKLYCGGGGAIKRSTDFGATWSNDLASNIGSKNTCTLAISADNSSRLFASIASGGNSIVARSDDAGKTWQAVLTDIGYLGTQGGYDNACAVSQTNADYVSVGGLDIYRSIDGGTTWTQATDWRITPGTSSFTHADVHVLIYGSGGLWALTDGGAFLSSDNAKNWSSNRNNTLSTMLFVGGDADPDFTFVVGGAQDNGVNKASTASTVKTFKEKLGGDGGRTFVSQTDGTTVYSTYVNAYLEKSPNGGESWNIGPQDDHNVLPLGGLRNEGAPFYMNYDVCESDAGVVAMVGYSNLYYSDDGVATARAIGRISSKFGGSISAVHIPAADPSSLYVGGSGYAYVSNDIGATWKKSTTAVSNIVDITTDPNDASHAWAALAGNSTKHIAYTTDYGDTWQFPATFIPDINASCIARAPNGDLFLGHYLGVLRSIDNGVTWESLRDGMPLSQVTKLRVRGKTSKFLLATTYGHGMYKLNIDNLPRFVGVNDEPSIAKSLKINSFYPNPAKPSSELTLSFSQAAPGHTQVTLYDVLGREVKVMINEYLEAGDHTVTLATPETAGIYWAVLTANGTSVTQKIVLQSIGVN